MAIAPDDCLQYYDSSSANQTHVGPSLFGNSAMKSLKDTARFVLAFLTVVSMAFGEGQQGVPSIPAPGPLTADYTFNNVSFHYPNNWDVEARSNNVTVAPSQAFIKKTDGNSFVTHGFFLGVAASGSRSLDDETKQILTAVHSKTPRINVDTNILRHTGNPASTSCGDTFDPKPPYEGTETGEVCTIRIGDYYVWMMSFSPTTDWTNYHRVFLEIARSLSTRVKAQPQTIPIPEANPQRSGCGVKHWIESVEGDGKFIKLEDDSLWLVDDVDTVITGIWLPISDVVVCGNKMINVDDSESARVSLIQSGSSAKAGKGYEVTAATGDDTFVIDGEIFKAKTYCFSVDKGDKVLFIEGSPQGACVSAKFLDLRTGKVCGVWCP